MECVRRSFKSYEVDVKLICDVIERIKKLELDGNILVFLPGMRAINETKVALRQKFQSSIDIVPLHSSITVMNMLKIKVLINNYGKLFSQNANVLQGDGKPERRVYLATNVAETSLTLNNIAHVIDGGSEKEKLVDINDVEELAYKFISKVYIYIYLL